MRQFRLNRWNFILLSFYHFVLKSRILKIDESNLTMLVLVHSIEQKKVNKDDNEST